MRRLWIVSLVLAIALAACRGPAQPAATPAAAAAGAPGLTGKLSVAGSTSVQPLAEKLAEAFSATNPNLQIDVQGGGSSVGIKSAGEGTVDIGTASRALTDQDKATYPDLKGFQIARDAIAIVVNNGVAVSDLSPAQVKSIFSGQITNWREVGGADAPIVVICREEGSGTRDAFQSLVMGDATIVETAILQSSNGALRTAVSTTPNAIGILSLGYLDQSLKAVAIGGVQPTAENARSGEYPLVRPFNLLTRGEPSGLAQAWINWVLSPEGQKVVTAEHYLPAK